MRHFQRCLKKSGENCSGGGGGGGGKFSTLRFAPPRKGRQIYEMTELITLKVFPYTFNTIFPHVITVKILKIGTPEIITIIVLQLEQLDFTV